MRRCDGATVGGATVRRCDGATVRPCDRATVDGWAVAQEGGLDPTALTVLTVLTVLTLLTFLTFLTFLTLWAARQWSGLGRLKPTILRSGEGRSPP